MHKYSYIVAVIGSAFLMNMASAEVNQPSFDCKTATQTIDKLICSDSGLSALDAEMAEVYNAAKPYEEGREGREFVRHQHIWLKNVRNLKRCTKAQVECLKDIYKERIAVLEKGEYTVDGKDTLMKELEDCTLFLKNPKKAKKFAISLFYDNNHPSELCRDKKVSIEGRVPEVQALLKMMEEIRGEKRGNQICTGTVPDRDYQIREIILLLAATDPYPDVNDPDLIFWGETQKLNYVPDIKHWAQQGNWEKERYAALQKTAAEVSRTLQTYYKNTFHVSSVDAKKAADYYIQRLIWSYTGDSGASSTLAYPSHCLDVTDLKNYLKTKQLPTKICPYAEYVDNSDPAILRKLLGLAIVNGSAIADIQILVEKAADINLKNLMPNENRPDTPLMMAAPRPDIVALLLKAGADVKLQNWFGKTALMYAVQAQNLESVKQLLKAGADVNQATLPITYEDENGCLSSLKAGNRTALMYAAWQGTPEMVELLVAAKADVGAKDSNGESAKEYVVKNTLIDEGQKREMERMLGD
jgi:uncharacterized protein